MAMPWLLAQRLAREAMRGEREHLLRVSTAMRAAQADEKGWTRWVRELEPDL